MDDILLADSDADTLEKMFQETKNSTTKGKDLQAPTALPTEPSHQTLEDFEDRITILRGKA